MNQELLHKLIEAIVAEVVRRVAILERQKQHPEDVLVLTAAPIAYPKELKALLKVQFGEGFDLEEGHAHLDAELFGFVATRYDTAIVAR